jgi:hypothetical protein
MADCKFVELKTPTIPYHFYYTRSPLFLGENPPRRKRGTRNPNSQYQKSCIAARLIFHLLSFNYYLPHEGTRAAAGEFSGRIGSPSSCSVFPQDKPTHNPLDSERPRSLFIHFIPRTRPWEF